MTEFLFTAKTQRKYSMALVATRALSSLRPLRLCGELKIPSILVYDLNPRQVVLQIDNSYFNAIMLTVPG